MDSGGAPKSGFYPPEWWLFISGTLVASKRNGGFFRPDYADDGNGNLTGKGKVFVESATTLSLSATEGESWSYEYDLENWLTAVRHGLAGTDSLTRVTSYLYDPLGMKIQTSSVKRGQSITIHGIDGTLVY